MKKIFLIVLLGCISFVSAQSSPRYFGFHKLINIEGTKFVFQKIESFSKYSEVEERYLSFINTENGEINRIDFPLEGQILNIEQVYVPTLKINKILVEAKTKDVVGKKGINWDDPSQIFLISADGKEKQQLTEDNFFVKSWVVNQETGNIVITGTYSLEQNYKIASDTDETVVLIYDLKTLKLVKKILNK